MGPRAICGNPRAALRIQFHVRVLLIAACLPLLLPAQDAADIARRAIAADQKNDEVARSYTFLQREQLRLLDTSGRERKRTVKTFDITLLDGSGYRRLVSRDDKPLSSADQKKEDEALQRSNEQRRKETGEERNRRIAEWERKRRQERAELGELPEAFNLRIEKEDRLAGRDVWVVAGTPKPGFKSKTETGRKYFSKMTCRFWIDKQDYSWLRAELTTLDTISRGGVLVRIGKGGRIVVEQTRLNDEVWLPKRVEVNADARVLLVKGLKIAFEVDFSEFKKFQTDSRIVSVGEIK
jgi:hypothetical protein